MRRPVLLGASAAAIVALVGGGLALQLLSGGVRGQTLGAAVLAVLLAFAGPVLVAHRPALRIGQLILANAALVGIGTLAAGALDYGSVHPIPRLAGQASFAALWLTAPAIAMWALFILWFPDGRFPGRGWRRFFVAGTLACAGAAVAGWLAGPADHVYGFYGATTVPPGAAGPFANAATWLTGLENVLLAFPLVSLAALVQRYRRGGPVLRQQARWLLVGISIQVLAQVTASVLESGHGAAHEVGTGLSVATQPLPILGGTFAILRYRLWEIDLVVSRALVYGAIWAGLSALFLAPALAAGVLVGGRGALAAVGIALLVTIVFHPTRRRLERVVERLVYRHRARPYALLTELSDRLRSVDLPRIGPLLATGVHETLGVDWASVWAVDGGVVRPLGTSGAGSGPAVSLPAAALEPLRESAGLVLAGEPPTELTAIWPDRPAAVVPLVAADELVGLLVCGQRRGDRLGAADFELLELLARHAALRLRNLGLEAALREQLAEIEAQAEELQRSRQRLVTAQDEERRRIERDLHDGVQQQLVALAVRLQQLSSGARAGEGRLLSDLASEAEQAVFALQELGRGIYPSVLADQGLTAALRTQAARLPLAVRIDADEELAGRRLDAELEAALYFVALEALTNVQKHAPGAAALVRLGAEDGHVVLEIADDGPGLNGRGRAGTGLQNISDRIAAVGGRLETGTGPDGGTRIAASAPLAAAQPRPAADSRR
jgi:signal transduction histidine kinase